MKEYLKLMRVKHYIKNLLVFAALLCSGQFWAKEKIAAGGGGFAAFCLLSSAVYIINDIRDIDKDRSHPTKCRRPLAAGTIPVSRARILAVVLAVIAMAGTAAFFQPAAVLLLALYFVVNLGYSFGLKDIPLVDITLLVAGFFLRIVFGAVVTGITISNWLYLTVIAFAFYFAMGKRRNETMSGGSGQTRRVLAAYPQSFLDKGMYMFLTLANMFYALWCMDAVTIERYGGANMVLTVPVVLLITLKYSLDMESGSDGDPVEVVLHDKVLTVLCVLYLCLMAGLLYL